MVADRSGDDPIPRAGGGAYRKTPTQLATDPAFTGTYALLGGALPVVPRRGKAQRIITGFQSGHGWTSSGFGSIDLASTADTKLGVGGCVAFTTNNTSSSCYLVSPTWSTAVDFTSITNVAVWVKITANVGKITSTGLSVHLSSGDGAFTNAYVINATTPANLPMNTWVLVPFPLAEATTSGAPSLSTIKAMRIRIGDNSAGAVTGYYGGVVFEPTSASFPNGVVSFTCDDGFSSHYTRLAPMLAAYGVTATAFPIQELLDTSGRLTTAQLQSLHDDFGWSVGAHSITAANHSAGFTTLSAAALDAELRGCKEGLLSRGLTKGADTLAWPISAYNATTERAAARYYSAALTTASFPRQPFPWLHDRMATNRYMLDAATVAGTVTAEIDKTYANAAHLVIGVHDVVASGATGFAINSATLQTVVDYCATKGIPVRAVDDVIRSEP